MEKEVKPITEIIKQSEENEVLKKRIEDLEEELAKCKGVINGLSVKCQEFEITVKTIIGMSFLRK